MIITCVASKWETMSEYKDGINIKCVHSSKRKYIHEEDKVNNEQSTQEYENTPAKTNKDLSAEDEPKQKYPYTGIMLCTPCVMNNRESI